VEEQLGREEAALAALKSQCADAVGVHRSLSASLTSSTTAAERLQEAIDDVCMWVVHARSRVRTTLCVLCAVVLRAACCACRKSEPRI
jgi:hypothetical protein